jgi:Acyl-CoA reductase (LuxC)
MIVEVRVPERRSAAIVDVLDQLTAAPCGEPFADDVIEFAQQLSTRLTHDPVARVHPELLTLARFLRGSEIVQLKRTFEDRAPDDVVRVPHGLVFQLAPSMPDTFFVYAWLMSALAGNCTIVRLSRRSGPVVEHLCDVVNDLFRNSDLRHVAARTAMISYGHDDAITAAISARARVRLLTGRTGVMAAPGTGRDLPFPHRFSLIALGAAMVANVSDDELRAIAYRLYDDIYWFDQRACSSPRLAMWIGAGTDVAVARARLWPAVADVATERGYQLDVTARLDRELFVHRAILDGPVVARHDIGRSLVLLRVDRLDGLTRTHPGHGVMYDATAPSLVSLERWIDRHDQTLCHVGIPRHELVGFVERLAGRGIDRVVPVGQAHGLSSICDGMDLVSQLVRHVQLLV